MTTYYKATRPDGTDFRTGTILYEVGKRVRPKRSRKRRICGLGYLHASDVPTETLIGGSWPCRLFEVEGKPVVGFDDEHPHKGGFRQLRVVKELPAHQVFGPQGKELVAHFERCKKLTAEEAKELYATRDAARDATRDAAWDAAWYTTRDAARDAAWYATRDAARDVAWDAAWDAALAILTRDLIGQGEYTQEHHDLLYSPWKKVIG